MQQQQKNKTPRSHQKSRGHQGQASSNTKQEYETHWTKDEVGHAIKQGRVFVGPIRVNPKNYKESYVPQPDGKADVIICGMEDRNRALNTDLVVVEPYCLDKWRISLEEFDQYQASMSMSKEICDNHNNRGAAVGVDKKSDGADDDYDSGPDVIIESDNDTDNNAASTNGDVERSMDALDLNHKHSVCPSKAENVMAALKNLQKVKDNVGHSESNDISRQSKPKDSIRQFEPKDSVRQSKPKDNTRQTKSSEVSFKPLAGSDNKFVTVAEMRKLAKSKRNQLAMDLFGDSLQEAVSVFGIGNSLVSKFIQATGKVVAIYEKKHCRAVSGRIKPTNDKYRAMFIPTDNRIPGILVPIESCPKGVVDRPKEFENIIFIGRILSWEKTSKMPWGTICRSLGEAGHIEPETEAMLMEMDVDDSPFSEEVVQCLPQNLPWVIPQEEFSYRKDLRQFCIFTIDPATARDLDDAVSIESKADGTYEVGVHIADVSYFVKEETELDTVASKRATSVYLVQKVVPMLPRLLCEELCSLNPDEDRLAFSVMWTINDQGEILDEWFGRTVIRSCVKLSYDHAQGFIDEPEREWLQRELPSITNSFKVQDIKERVLQLNKLAVFLRQRRYDSGALRLDQVKLQYSLNQETGMPNGYSVYKQRDSNRLIEEFMLLANMAVAHRIKNHFPEKAVLRRHPSPKVKPLQQVVDVCDTLGVTIDSSTAGTLNESLNKYRGLDDASLARIQVLVSLLSRPMQNAKYFCTGVFQDESMYHHYALNVPLYTHFTSPIRRYPDIMVHRVLAASLEYAEVTSLETPVLQRQADHCNDKKLNAKMASDRSSDMFFSIFVKECGPLEEKGMVMAVLDKSFDVLVLKLGVVKRVYLEKLPIMNAMFRKNMKSPELHLVWDADEQCSRRTSHVIRLFSMVDCKLYAESRPLQYSCVIYRPKEEIQFRHLDANSD